MIEQLIQQAQPYWQQYIEHEFVQQLAKGTLPKACFQHYLKQDYSICSTIVEPLLWVYIKQKILRKWKFLAKR